MAKVLVTGASGFTGFNLCNRLVRDGEQVVAFVRKTSRIDKLKKIGVECRIVDIRDQSDVWDHFEKFSKVFHIAAAFRAEHVDVSEFEKVNTSAVENILTASIKHEVPRIVHSSTVGVQGEINDPPAAEDYRYQPGDHYQDTKLKGELIAKRYMKKGYPVSIVRPVGIYGPGDSRFLKLFRPINKRKFVMIGSGRTLYHLTFIDDLVEGFILCGTRPEAIGEVFTVAGPRYTTLRELVDLIADVLEKPHPSIRIPFFPVYLASHVCEKLCKAVHVNPPLYPRRVEFFSKDRAFDISKAKKILDYTPKIDLEKGLKMTADWYREQGLI